MGENSSTIYWRDYIPPTDTARSKELANSNTYQWATARCAEPFLVGWTETWKRLDSEPYKGITVDGNVIPNLYRLAEKGDEGVEVVEMLKAAHALLEVASPEQRQSLSKEVDSPEWRRWLNPEIYIHRHGVRLEEVSVELVTAIHDLMRASLSPAGYFKASGCMKVNGFLGEVVNGTKVLNERSYNFAMFGIPSTSEPWGWQLFGHHFDMNCFVLGKQMVISPVFMGAEPNVIDDGLHKGLELFTDQEQTALKLILSMDKATLDRVRIYTQLSGPEYPPGRFHRADQRTLSGAFQDNRVIPYEGPLVTSFTSTQQDLVRDLIVLGINYLPSGALEAKLAEIATHWDSTHFCWIGAFARDEGFYYKVHSPVLMIEFDHHSGVFLDNKVPLPFHIHTIIRTPNGYDYGKDLLRLYRLREGKGGI
jgi:hypothetical protein